MEGFIKFEREWLNNPIICKDKDYLIVWLYLNVQATYEKREVLFKGEQKELSVGQLVIKQVQVAKELKVDRSKLIRILKAFKNAHLIEQEASNKETLISLKKNGDYQGKNKHQVKQQMNTKCTTVKEGEKEKRTKREKEREIYKKERKIDVCVEGETHTEKKALLGKYENVLVDRKWLEDFKAKYSYWGEVVESLSRYKAAKGITNARDEPYLESFAQQDRERYAKRIGEIESTFDADEFFEAALARSYAQMEDL